MTWLCDEKDVGEVILWNVGLTSWKDNANNVLLNLTRYSCYLPESDTTRSTTTAGSSYYHLFRIICMPVSGNTMANKLFVSVLNGKFKFFLFPEKLLEIVQGHIQLFRPINAPLIAPPECFCAPGLPDYFTGTHIYNSCIISDFLLLTDFFRVDLISRRKYFLFLWLSRHSYGQLADTRGFVTKGSANCC